MKTIEGKTKRIDPLPDRPGYGRVISKDDLTAGDGVKHDIMAGKAKLANATTCHVFDLLKSKGVPVAYEAQDGDTFITKLVTMIPVEVVVRNEAAGSFCKRNTEIVAGTIFDEPIVEFYYKTTGRDFFGVTLDCDDPLMIFSDDGTRLALHYPGRPIDHERPLFEISYAQMSVAERRLLHEQLKFCKGIALQTNKYLAEAWRQQEGRLVDFKVECGILPDGTIVLSDVIDCDSWRVMWKGLQLSKQSYRDGADLAKVLSVYQLAERVTRGFWY